VSFVVLFVICRLHYLRSPFKIPFYLVPPIVFSLREKSFFYLETIRRFSWNGTTVSHWRFHDVRHMKTSADVSKFKILPFLHFPVPPMNRLNQTESATFSILFCWTFFWDSVFLYFWGWYKNEVPLTYAISKYWLRIQVIFLFYCYRGTTNFSRFLFFTIAGDRLVEALFRYLIWTDSIKPGMLFLHNSLDVASEEKPFSIILKNTHTNLFCHYFFCFRPYMIFDWITSIDNFPLKLLF
jgi:hypothetical protein